MIRRDLLTLVLSAWAISAVAGCSRAATPSPARSMGSAAASPSSPPSAAPSASSAAPVRGALEPPMNATDPRDLAWLDELVKALESGTVTREQVIAFLGTDAGPSPTYAGGRVVRPRSALLAEATVYPMPHIEIKVAMELTFAPVAMPALDALAQRLGAFKPLPRSPDDFSSGDKFVHYSQRADTKTEVRVFAELAHGAGRKVAKLHIDVEAL